ncbi:hypothetical protein PIB19_05805 [Sphingomonas sp. 7/4-4]|uniref:hypothetical protein n=1 Tax=Sphingomonas sp. 7/4-4 TaxID=3018446 RepID=UPI0022F3AA4D|nr:hypothetical protein [Sphingomonas sp. 7/4-4]WBY08916.1 hypothetical protein PIB19_05805 [Sphingomonas sp. 7/4-4]
MALDAQLEAEMPRFADPHALDALGVPARLAAAIERAADRLTGMIAIAGPGAEETAAALHRRFGIPSAA